MKLFEVDKNKQQNYLEKFSDFSSVIAIEAILKGDSKGKLYVNDCDHPTLLIIWNEFDGFYVSLSSDEEVEYVKEAITGILNRNEVRETEFVIYIHPEYDKYIHEIMPVSDYSKLEVLYYSGEERLSFDLNEPYYRLMGMDEFGRVAENDEADVADGLDDHEDWHGFEEIKETILSTWYDYETFLKAGTGIAAVDEQKGVIIGYCIAEHMTADSVEFSIEVDEGHQGKGVGTLLGRAMLNRCVELSKRPCWYCTDDNTGSLKLAEKLGLRRQSGFHVWYFEMDSRH